MCKNVYRGAKELRDSTVLKLLQIFCKKLNKSIQSYIILLCEYLNDVTTTKKSSPEWKILWPHPIVQLKSYVLQDAINANVRLHRH